MNNGQKTSDQRKFVRIITNNSQGQIEPIEKLTLHWDSGEIVPIYDISYGGVACQLPQKEDLQINDFKAFTIVFPAGTKEKFIAKIVWKNKTLLGLNFESLSLKARMELNQFLDNKILGVSLRLIDKKYYSQAMTCQYWYQGHYGVNIYLWENEGKIVKGEVEFDNSIVSINKDSIEWSRSLEALEDQDLKKDLLVKKSIDILSQVAVNESNVQEFLKQVLSRVTLGDRNG